MNINQVFPPSKFFHNDHNNVLHDLEERTIFLTPEEIEYCISEGKEQTRKSIHFNNHKVSEESDEHITIAGTVCQVAVAKYLSIPYVSTIGTFKKPDLPGRIEVRGTMQPLYRLKIHLTGDEGKRMVMAIWKGFGHPVILPGWIEAEAGLKIGDREDPHDAGLPAVFVRQIDLRQMQELKYLICLQGLAVAK